MVQQTQRADRLAARRAQEARQSRRRRRLTGALSAAVAAVLVAVVVVLAVRAWSRDDDGTGGVDPDRANVAGEVVYRDLAREHVSGPVSYPASPVPPVGGPHDGAWQNANGDVYPEPLRAEHAVHSLEHGAVWVTYRGDLPPSGVDTLRAKVAGIPYRLMSPLPDQPGLITLTAWGHQLTVDSAADPRIDEFLTAYTQGPQAPEPGAPVTGGRAQP
ncbi:hypothetical protein DMB66_26330 [Actinoplanes sp. ATCC 53533]|uniref:DUF3105 domain-containing protein n=1 Tax=Actinoplanes sp. ATCC 53533 TaxID=1288362 RepID=UPI000F7B6A79|nr:DUF3105 domain-containing protein [Actinoplanes sp. ATCC 53533]RSM59772.1 hypothetical protein DMB66_26330 [Actinoplanes sp. ATCC 53533]